MTSIQQREALKRQIWQIANEVRGAVDGWDFKQYVLGALFYRFISENFANYIEADDDSVKYADIPDDNAILEQIKSDAIIDQLFKNDIRVTLINLIKLPHITPS